MPEQLPKQEKSKKSEPKPAGGFWSKLLSALGMRQKENDQTELATDKSVLTNAYLLKTEIKKGVRLSEKLDKEYLQRDLKLYQSRKARSFCLFCEGCGAYPQ
jgi:hypothetical protein